MVSSEKVENVVKAPSRAIRIPALSSGATSNRSCIKTVKKPISNESVTFTAKAS